MDLNITQNCISLWFVCKSCEFTFSFSTVDEFLAHKEAKHTAEFQKTRCIVFEERKQDEVFALTDEEEETKLFAQDDDEEDRYVVVELCPGSGTSELFTETAEPPSPGPLPVPKPASPPVELVSHSDTAIRATESAALKEEKSKHEYEFNGDFGLFSSRFNTSEDDPRDLQADLVHIDSSHTAASTQLVQSHVDFESDSSDFSPENLDSDPDFNFADSDADSDDSNNVEDLIDPLSDDLCDGAAPNNSTLPNTLNPTLKNPFVLLRRLTPEELASSSSNLVVSPSSSHNKRKMKLRTQKKKRKKGKNSNLSKPSENSGPFLCTICSKPFNNKYARGLHIRAHYGSEIGPRPISCSYPDCTASFRHPSELDIHIRRHKKAELNPNSKSMFSARNLIFQKPKNQAEIDPLTLRKWLLEQKFQHKESNSTRTETQTKTDPGNLILLDPDLTEMDEIATGAFKISGETPIKCRLCSQNLKTGAEVKVHATHCWLRNKLRHVYCLPCNKTLCSPHVLRKHTVKRHTLVRKKVKPLYPCPQCAYMSKSKWYLTLHMETHKSQEERGRPWVCEICGLAYPQKQHLKNHQRIHGEKTPFKCPHPGCGRAFKARPNLNSHLRNHIQSKSFTCPKEGCSKSFKMKHELTLHLRTLQHSGVSRHKTSKLFKCEYDNCGKLYQHLQALNRHRISAHGAEGELPTFECHICGKTFTYKISLTRHVWAHNNDSPFKCTHEGCGKTCRNKTALAEHMYTHTGERPYQCDLCGKDYNAKSSLNRHLEWHQIDSLPFNCEQCEKSFKTVYNLKDHVNRIHKKNSTVKVRIEAGSLIEADLY